VKYAFIDVHRQVWPVSLLCEQLEVSASGYHQHSVRKADQGPNKPVRRSIGNDALLAHIKAIHAQVKGEYGWPRIWKELLARSIRVGKERVRTLMAQHGIRARAKRRFKATTDSRHNLPVAPNLVARDFAPQAPNTVWSTDITYIDTDEGWLYLTVMLDLFSRQVVGWAIGPRMTKGLVLDALRMAWFRRRPEAGLIVHSDRGTQYCSHEFQAALRAYGMTSSMSRKADCWDNAPTESLWSSLKRARLHGRHFATRQAAQSEVMDWLAFYNATRLHSTLGYVSPMQHERNWLAAQDKKSA
jgi:transposase InsO family protein